MTDISKYTKELPAELSKLKKYRDIAFQKYQAQLHALEAFKSLDGAEEYRNEMLKKASDEEIKCWLAEARIGELLGPGEEAKNQYTKVPSNNLEGIDHNARYFARRFYNALKSGVLGKYIEKVEEWGPVGYRTPLGGEGKKEESDYEWFIYNYWNTKTGDDTYFGHFPMIFMRNLLNFHTKEGQLVFDPFAGTGTTIDACQQMNRRSWCSDINPQRDDIHQHDVSMGWPKEFKETPDIVFLDPPYWIQAKGEYTNEETDLGNVSYNDFNDILFSFFDEIEKRGVNRIAYVNRAMWDTSHKANWRWINPIVDFHEHAARSYRLLMHYYLPYSTQQFSARWVGWAKQRNICLSLIRDLWVWEAKDGQIQK